MILNYCRVSVAYNLQIGQNKMKVHMEYEIATQIVLLHSAVLIVLLSFIIISSFVLFFRV
jgi:hypothetical protein